MSLNGNRLVFISILIFQTLCPAVAADFKQCESVRIGINEVDSHLVLEILKQNIKLTEYGKGEDNIELIATAALLPQMCITGMITAKGFMLAAKSYHDKDSEKKAHESYLALGKMCGGYHQLLEDRLNEWVPLIKNQSIRDDVKKIKQNNLLALKKLSPCIQ